MSLNIFENILLHQESRTIHVPKKDINSKIKSLNEILECVEFFKVVYVKIYNQEMVSPNKQGSRSPSDVSGNGESAKNLSYVSGGTLKDNTSDFLDMKEKEIGSFKVVIKLNSDNRYDIFFDEVTDVLEMQQINSDFMYQDAVESNYSHE